MIQWKKVLKSLGFSESEATIYLTALEAGPSSVQDLAKHAKISRVTTYAVIETLASKGLMSWTEKGKKKLYLAEAPERLMAYVGKQVKEMESTLKEVESSMEELKLLQRGERPIVKIFEGIEGLHTIYDEVIKSALENVYEIGDIDKIYSVLPTNIMKPFKDELEKRKIKTQAIIFSKQDIQHRPSTKVKIVREKKDQVIGDMIIFGNKLALSTFHGKFISVLIENGELASTVRELFHLAWKNL